MKNILTIFAFAATLFIGAQSASAQSLTQDQNRPEAIAKETTHTMTEKYGLNGDQTRAVFRALVTKEVDYQKNVNGKDLTSATVQSQKDKIDNKLRAEMKKILTADQYAAWEKDQ